jgi:hypothetical protein
MLKTETAYDRRPLERAADALFEAKRSLKAFAQTQLVHDTPELADAVRTARKQLKKTKKRLQALADQVEVITESTDDDTV